MKRKFDGTILTAVALVGAAFLMGACSTQAIEPNTMCSKVDQNNDVFVEIAFNEEGCPTGVDNGATNGPPFDVRKTDRIIWQSAGSGGTTPGYEIYFDPFKGRPLKSNGQGKKQSPKFDSCSPEVEYKYTIVGDDCKHTPLDPRFRLR